MKDEEEKELSCAECGTLNCHKHESRYPKFCLTTNVDEEMLESLLNAIKMKRVLIEKLLLLQLTLRVHTMANLHAWKKF